MLKLLTRPPPFAVSSSLRHLCARRHASTGATPAVAETIRKDQPSPPGKAKAKEDKGKKPAAAATPPPPKSSCAPDTLLPGINYLKGQAPITARADEEYPEWLWGILQPKVAEDEGVAGGRAERLRRRKENQQAIKDRNFMQTQ